MGNVIALIISQTTATTTINVFRVSASVIRTPVSNV
jgi:hypothetical protein